MAAKEEERKTCDPPVKLIAKIEDLALDNEAKTNGETCGDNDRSGTKGAKKAIIVEKSTGAPLVTVRSRRSIMESRFRLTLKTWDDVWRSTSWAKNPPKQIKMASIKGVVADDQQQNCGGDSVNEKRVENEGRIAAVSNDVESLRKTVSDTNVNDKEPEKQILHIATDEDIAVRDKEADETIDPLEAAPPVEGQLTPTEAVIENVTLPDPVEEKLECETQIELREKSTAEPVPKKIKNTRFMVVPSVQVPSDAESEKADREAGTAGSSDSEETTQNAASRNRVPMFESRLNELTMVESQLKKLDFKPMHLELPEDRDSDESVNSKTITAAESKTMKIKDAIPPRRNNSLEGAYPPQSKKKSKNDTKSTWGWLSIFRRKPSSQQIVASPATKQTSTSGSLSSQKQTRPSASHQSRSRQPQRSTTTVLNARRTAAQAAQQQQVAQANTRIVLIQVRKFVIFFGLSSYSVMRCA